MSKTKGVPKFPSKSASFRAKAKTPKMGTSEEFECDVDALDGCCAVAVMYDMGIEERGESRPPLNDQILKDVLELREERYGAAMATTSSSQRHGKRIEALLVHSGFKIVTSFTNPKTHATINLWLQIFA